MKRSNHAIAAAALALLAMLNGCSKAPTQAVQEAEVALRAVEEADAAQYAPASLNAAKEAMAKLKAELTAQEGKSSFLRRFGTAERLAAAAKLSAETALSETQAAKQRAHDAAVARIESSAALLEIVRPMLATAPKGKGSEMDLRMLEADLAGVENTMAEARAALAAGDYILAETKAAAAGQSLGGIKTAVEAAQSLHAQAQPR